MKRFLLIFFLSLFIFPACSKGGESSDRDASPSVGTPEGKTPVEKYGQLKVVGTQLCDESGNPVQLKGMSTHGLQWYSKCQTRAAYQSLAQAWKCSVVRLALYPEEGGYNTDPQKFRDKIETLAGYCEEFGIYCIIDWHVLTPGNPDDAAYSSADAFFEWASDRFKGEKHIIYEICNEPNGGDVTWNVVKAYADRIIPIIRRNAPSSVVICGTPNWSAQFKDVVDEPLNYSNILYAYHFYAATHYNYDNLKDYLNRLPVFVTEWGTCESNGSGNYDLTSCGTWLKILNGDNPGGQKVSWTAWNFSDGTGTADNLIPGSGEAQNFTNVKQPCGQYIRDKIREK